MGKPRIICQPGTSHQRERASRKREAHERLTGIASLTFQCPKYAVMLSGSEASRFFSHLPTEILRLCLRMTVARPVSSDKFVCRAICAPGSRSRIAVLNFAPALLCDKSVFPANVPSQ